MAIVAVNLFAAVREVAMMRVSITLACGECKRRNYITTKNKKNDANRIELKKYCGHCKVHTLHRETR
jgi:large subunit ribosomal protein L33